MFTVADWATAVSVVVAVLVVVSFYVSWRASRLDRMHTRVETASAALDAALLRRGAAVLELASRSELEPASAILLADAAAQARRASNGDGDGERELAESNLSRALREVVDQPGFHEAVSAGADGDELLVEVGAVAKQVHLARRFYNDAVARTREARASRLVRVLRLAGHARLPEFFDMDDEPPRFARLT
ncbi:hypothetical protein [Halostreptopolyspora alba]|uniref:LemA family protein n=1 Tax=Halostreptopolyspora alba TaxID=2487137 RepID=A0A3N0E777_9ACTN|nr:hypothetical protein EFW17_15410 [Nocardiopsaceae bacterium YIM 96095]